MSWSFGNGDYILTIPATGSRDVNRNVHPFFFRWLHDLLRLGLKRPIVNDDIYRTLKSHESKTLTDTFSERWNHKCRNKNKPKLSRVLRQIYAKRVIGVSFIYTILSIAIRYLKCCHFFFTLLKYKTRFGKQVCPAAIHWKLCVSFIDESNDD